jgi:hypothetical protein
VIKSWDATFRGNAADVFLMSISTAFDRPRDDVYARFSSVVNSAGTGKSRMVDQIAKKVVTIPICLRGKDRSIQGMLLYVHFMHADILFLERVSPSGQIITGLALWT